MNFIEVVEILGVLSFALSGASAAMQKRLDVFGVLVMCFVTAIGGGTVRDVIIGRLPVAWLMDMGVINTIVSAFLLAIFFRRIIDRLPHTLFWLDTVGLALFCVVAIGKGYELGFSPAICVTIGTITGCFGGIIRDVLLNEIPYVFRKDIYASACILGGAVYVACHHFTNNVEILSIISGTIIILIRTGAHYLNWRMPDIYKLKENN